MGSVYLAEQTSMGRQVALKVLPPAYTRDQVFLDRFIKEIRLQGALSHPNIATAFDAGKFHDIYYLAMEFVEGQDLCDLIAKQKQVEEKSALRIVRKAAAGLAYAWSRQNLIHRDIKPGNIMIAPGEEVKILDLGISTSGSQNDDTGCSTDESVIGTPHYMSPEQARESASVDLRSDIYSLGATLYHMVTGRAPFPGDTLVEVVTRQVAGPAPAPQILNPRVSGHCAHLLEVMMAKDVLERYENWDDCIADIGRVLGGFPPLASHPRQHGSMIEASPRPEEPSPEPGVKRQRTAMPLVAVLTVVLIGFLIWGVVVHRQVAAFEQELVQASLAPSEVMASFAGDIGQEIVVVLTRGPKRLLITEMGQDAVSGTQDLAQGSLTYTFRYRDLALQEKVSRLARTGTPASLFMLGLLALEAEESRHAISSFGRAGGELSTALADRLSESQSEPEAANHLE